MRTKILMKFFCVFAIFSLIAPIRTFAAASNSAPSIAQSAQEYGAEREMKNDKPHSDAKQSNGAMVYDYQITAPPGRNGMQPDLSLSYNNQDKNNHSIFGYGWSMNIPYIERINREGVEKLYSENYYSSSLQGELSKLTQATGASSALAANQPDSIASSTQTQSTLKMIVYSGSGDGEAVGRNQNWSVAHNAANGFHSNFTNFSTHVASQYASGDHSMIRMFLPFDLADLPSNINVSEAVLNVYAGFKGVDASENDGNDFIRVVEASQATTTSVSAEDVDQCGSINNPAALANDKDITSDILVNQYNSFVLNQSGKNLVKNSAGGWIRLGLREGHDIANDPLTEPAPKYSYVNIKTSENAGTSTDPYLEITYVITNTPTAPTNLLVGGRANPTNTEDTPEFSAVYHDSVANDIASYYRIQISASSSDWTNLAWDSAKTALSNQLHQGGRSEKIIYAGNPLAGGTKYYWRIKFWDNENNEGEWSNGSDYFEAGHRYGAKIDNGEFLKYEFHDNAWTATDKKGTVYKFGFSASSRQDSENGEKIFKWMLDEIRDANGNYVKYEYYKDSGQIYPYKIKYTGHDSDEGIFQINFIREIRNDKLFSAAAGFNVTTKYRISEINSEINGSWAKKYKLSYTAGDNRTRSLLQKIAETGRDENNNETTIPATEFKYQTKNGQWAANSGYQNLPDFIDSENYCDNGARMVDVNGDSLVDIVYGNGISGPTVVYINKGDGTGWKIDSNYVEKPVIADRVKCYDMGVVFLDINGDGYQDWIQSLYANSHDIKSAYINKGDGTGWVRDDNYTGFPIITGEYGKDQGVRIADVNGDGLPDFIKRLGTETGKVYINKGDGTGWYENTNYSVPEPLYYDEVYGHDAGTRIIDVNGDDLADIIRSSGERKKVYINKGDGTGWALSQSYAAIPEFAAGQSYFYDTGNRFVDINGDGLIDIIMSKGDDLTYAKAVFINKGDGTGWSSDNRYNTNDMLLFIAHNGMDRGTRMEDINGDGLVDFLQSAPDNLRKFRIADGQVPDLLSEISVNSKKILGIEYKSSANYANAANQLLNPDLPFSMQTAYKIIQYDGLSPAAALTYEYSAGDYYFNNPFDRKFSGFGKIKETNGLGYVSNFYFHQGNSTASSIGEYNDDISKAGKIYRTEIYGNANNLYAKTINKWDKYNLGDSRDFVKMIQSVEFSYDGNSDHKEKASEYSYDNDSGNLTEKIFFGEVGGSDNGSFADVGADLVSTTITYATDTSSCITGFPSQELLKDQNGNKIRESKFYYDSLGIGNIGKGNLTKEEKWKSGTNYIDIEKFYDDYGLIISEKDPRDKTAKFIYDNYKIYIATATNPLGHAIQSYYDYSSGKTKKIIDQNGGVFETVFDGLDRIKEEKQPDISNPSSSVIKTSYTYNDYQFPKSVKQKNYLDSEKDFEIYSYFDALGRKIQERKETEDVNWFAVKDYSYNQAGLISKESLPYLSAGLGAASATENNNLYLQYNYDPLNRITSVINSVGTTAKIYDNWQETIIDPENKIKKLFYDAFGNLIKVDEHNAANIYSSYYEYNKNSNLIKITDALGNIRTFNYDGLGLMESADDLHAVSDANYGVWRYDYDDSGNMISFTDPKNQIVNFTYDDINRVLTENYTGGAGTEISYNYDLCLNGIGRLCSTNFAANIIENNYNAAGLVKSEKLTAGAKIYATQYEYDRQGNIALIKHPDNSETKYDYNTAGLPETVSKKENGATNYEMIINDIDYDPSGQISYQSYGNYAKNYYVRDSDQLYRLAHKYTVRDNSQIAGSTAMKSRVYAGNGDGDMYVDVDNNWNARHNAASGIVYDKTPAAIRSGNYDMDQLWRAFLPFNTSGLPDDAVISAATLNIYVDFMFTGGYFGITQTNQAAISSLTAEDYDACGFTHNPVEGTNARTKITATGWKSFALNTNGMNWISKTGYTKLGIRTAADLDDTAVYSDQFIRFHSSEQPGTETDPYLDITYTVPETNDYIQDLNYVYDKAGNIIKITDKSNTNTKKTIYYNYDDLHRLTKASSTNAVYGGDYLQTYAYNAIGNIINKSDVGNYTYADNGYNNPHAATNIGGTSHTYDNNGNLTNDGSWTHSWNYDNRLIKSANGAGAINYTYDPGGDRLTYSDGMATTTYVNKYFNVSSIGITEKNIYLGSQLIATIKGNGTATSTHYVHSDHLGGSNAITDSNGQIEQLIDYYPFGEMRINEKEGSFDEKRKFTGHEYDKKTELNYMVARYQNPDAGQFMSIDPMLRDGISREWLIDPQKLNSYNYVANNPLKYIDPFGLEAVIFYGGNKDNQNFFRDIAYQNTQQMIQNGYTEPIYVKEGSSPQQWNNALTSVKNIDYIGYYGHGGTGALYLSNTTTSKGKQGTTSIYNNSKNSDFDPTLDIAVNSLYNKNIEKNVKIELYSCNAGVGGSKSIAQAFASHFDGEAKGARAGLNFDNEGQPYVSHFYYESFSYWFEKNILRTNPNLWAYFWK
ncbi:MAG: RHS repeat-associated core domain-containing protein [bacterium]